MPHRPTGPAGTAALLQAETATHTATANSPARALDTTMVWPSSPGPLPEGALPPAGDGNDFGVAESKSRPPSRVTMAVCTSSPRTARRGDRVITYVLSTDVLGSTRFTFSPLAEVTLSLRLLGCPHPTHLHGPWLRQARQRLDGVDLSLLLAVTPPGKWIVSCLIPPSPGPQVTIEEQLRGLTQVAPDELRKDLDELWEEEPAWPRRVQELVDAGARGPGLLAEALWDYWDAAIEPFWTKMCAVLEDDVSYRVAAQMNGGLYALLEDLHPEVRLEGNLLKVDKPHHTSATYEAHAMTLTPSVFAWPGLVLDDGHGDRFGLTYAARGVGRVWRAWRPWTRTTTTRWPRCSDAPARPSSRGPRSRCRPPRSPASWAEPGLGNQHLSVLRGSGLVVSRRSGRSVLYRQTPLAQSMIAAQQVARHGAERAWRTAD